MTVNSDIDLWWLALETGRREAMFEAITGWTWEAVVREAYLRANEKLYIQQQDAADAYEAVAQAETASYEARRDARAKAEAEKQDAA